MAHNAKKQRILAPGPRQVEASLRGHGETAINLRWTSIALCEKMKRDKVGLSSQVADEVAAVAGAQVKKAYPHREVSYVERNTRRRVYDALKVLVAINCIERDGKLLRWVGVAHVRATWMRNAPTEAEYYAMGHSKSPPRPPVEKSKLMSFAEASQQMNKTIENTRSRIATKKQLIDSLTSRVSAHEALWKRNRERFEDGDDNCPKVAFPMIVIKGKPATLKVSSNRREVTTIHKTLPQVYTEADIVECLCAADPSLLHDLTQSTMVRPEPRLHKVPKFPPPLARRTRTIQRGLSTQPKRFSKVPKEIRRREDCKDHAQVMDDRVIRNEDLGFTSLPEHLETYSSLESTSTEDTESDTTPI